VAQDGGGVTKKIRFDSQRTYACASSLDTFHAAKKKRSFSLSTPFNAASFRRNEQPVDLGRP
jgi:hypothetical protein